MEDNFGATASPASFSINAQPKEGKKITRRKFTHEEDEILKFLVRTYGASDWQTIATRLIGRTARQCRERWKHYINPDVVTGNWTEEENKLLMEKYKEHGSQWAVIVKSFPGRTDIGVKNHYISLITKKNREKLYNNIANNNEKEENNLPKMQQNS